MTTLDIVLIIAGSFAVGFISSLVLHSRIVTKLTAWRAVLAAKIAGKE